MFPHGIACTGILHDECTGHADRASSQAAAIDISAQFDRQLSFTSSPLRERTSSAHASLPSAVRYACTLLVRSVLWWTAYLNGILISHIHTS
eukprot:14631831-Alexandrium_andersonii.AAC.1